MARPSKRHTRAAQRRQAAAVNLLGIGALLIVLPHLVPPIMTAALRPLSSIGWLLLAAGAVMVWIQRRKPSDTDKPPVPAARFAPTAREPRQPTRPVPVVRRVEPVAQPTARRSVLEPTGPQARVRPTAWSPNVFAIIEWRRFEALVEALFAQAGFLTKAQSHGPDEGVDVWLYSKNQPDGAPVSVVQCKHWNKPVGVDKVRELRGVMAAKGVERGQLASTSGFTADAVAFAVGNRIKLHDGAGLLELIGKRTLEQQQELLHVALQGDYWRPTCVNCGVKMVERPSTAGRKPFWGCTNYPRCHTKMQMRAA